jgi:predicted CXXCH cytochrome family protein
MPNQYPRRPAPSISIRISLICALVLMGIVVFIPPLRVSGNEPVQPTNLNPDAVCESCHKEIYRKYRETPMAQGSGRAIDGMIPADFLHKTSGIRYRITAHDSRVYLSYERLSNSPADSLKGEEQLLYFLGSGRRGRTYLFQRDGYWFEIPINWYAKKGLWDMAPNYQSSVEMPNTLPVDSSCLHCHASGVQAELADARNHYAAQPFLYGGITCEQCHGDPSQHLAKNGHGPILNPDKLPVDRRDSICLQCHLEAEISVNRPGRTLYDFHPGDEVSDDVVRFVHKNAVGAGGRATSQWEALLQSACKRQSGDRLTCTTCHDPHSSPSPEQAVAFYRGKCLSCHAEAKFSTAHHPEQPDCASCHMPRSNTQDIAHEQVTDHRIQIVGGPTVQNPGVTSSRGGELVSVRGVATSRDLGLAYAQLAERGDHQAATEAQRLLRAAEHDPLLASVTVTDADLHTQLGFLEQLTGNVNEATGEYRLALAANPFDATAAGDLALIEAKAGNLKQAASLWASVFAHDPTQKVAGFNLAATECQLGNAAAAQLALKRILRFSPDDHRAKQFAAAIDDGTQACSSR